MFIHRSIAAKIFLSFACVIAISFIIALTTYQSMDDIRTAGNWSRHTYQVLTLSKDMRASILKRESDMRGYMLTHDEALLERMKNEDTAFTQWLAAIKDLTRDNLSEQRRLTLFSDLVGAWHGALLPEQTGKGQMAAEGVLLDKVLQTLTDIDKEEEGLLSKRSARRIEAYQDAMRMNAIGPLAALCVAVFLSWTLHRVIAVPISRLTKAMGRLMEGDTSVDIPTTQWREEVGAISRAFQVFKTTLIEADRLRGERAELRLRSETDRKELMASTADRFEDVVGRIVAAVSTSANEMQSAAESVLQLAGWTSDQIKAAVDDSKKASATMKAVASETEILSSSVGQISAQMAHSANVAHQAVAEANRTTVTIEGLSESAKRIGVIVDLINHIAGQTNLLALNATIEAARAGDAGKGFAVVAMEVKALAAQTAKATDDIRSQIEGIQNAASGSVTAIGAISQTIGEMEQITEAITSAIELQREVTRDMALSTQATAQVAAETALSLGTVSDATLTTGTAATQLLAAAQDLARQSCLLSIEADRFTSTARAG
ncbi:methyl-accepting chemotaxis protein [Beijerinckia sp. L45]|uniref:methyl-accepting chemotaxis protein n=1 Tax=Beijerinckia sp. L45 TaxID=1641855 RepID=UPI00131C3FB8|nr:methyl-accepting chemotaxis protein [Beijerinckia sp. L45]